MHVLQKLHLVSPITTVIFGVFTMISCTKAPTTFAICPDIKTSETMKFFSHEISHYEVFVKFVDILQFSLKLQNNNGHLRHEDCNTFLCTL
jgi:hypothetical protein